MPNYLKIAYVDSSSTEDFDKNSEYKYRSTPFCASKIHESSILDCEMLVEDGARRIYHLKLSLANDTYNFEPGSTIGILPNNEEKLVNELIIRLGIEAIADTRYKLDILPSTIKKKTSLPKHIPESSTLRKMFMHHVDIKSIPKKMFLKSLMEFVKDVKEREELAHLCSPAGSESYKKLISNYSERSLLGLLNHFSSCQPPIENLIEHLPPLLPRYYSVSSSPLTADGLNITFDVNRFNNNENGLCSGWLEKCIDKYKSKECLIHIPMYFRAPTNFKLPDDNLTPIIMIATGTGISPFRSFLEHRHFKIISQNVSFGESWLIYGCRDSGNNYLFKKDLQLYLKSGSLTRLFESFSRETEEKNYVQHNIEKHGEEIYDLIAHKRAVTYVCGDFEKVLPAVKNSVLNILMKYQDSPKEIVELYFNTMIKEQRYIVENWT